MTRQTEQARADYLADRANVVGLGRHYHVELRGVADQNDDGTERQDLLRTCSLGEELRLEPSSNNHGAGESLKILRKSGEQLGFVAPNAEVASKMGEGRKFRVKLAKLYPYRGQGGVQGAVLDFEEVRIVAPAESSEFGTTWIVVIGIVVLLAAAGAAKLLGLF